MSEPNVLNSPAVVRLLGRIVSEARYGINCRESRQACQRIIEIIAEEAKEFCAAVLMESQDFGGNHRP